MSKKIDDISDNILLKKLENLGLSEKESRVYIALLSRQNTGTSNLIRATGLHGQFVYQALERLEEFGLAKHAIQNGRKKFSANPPLRILSILDEKRLSAQDVVRQLQSKYVGVTTQDFEVFQGNSAFIAHEFELLKQMPVGGAIDIIGGGGDSYIGILGDMVNEYERLRIEKKVSLRYLSVVGQHNYLKIMAQTRPFFDFRILPGDTHGVETDILLDKVSFHLYGDPVVSFTFTNKDIAEGYRKFFEVLWNLSSK